MHKKLALDRMNRFARIEAETGSPIAIFADLQGPKIRTGAFESDRIVLTLRS